MAETAYLGNSIEIRQYAVSIGYTNLQISRIQDKNTLWRGFRCRFRLAGSSEWGRPYMKAILMRSD